MQQFKAESYFHTIINVSQVTGSAQLQLNVDVDHFVLATEDQTWASHSLTPLPIVSPHVFPIAL